MPSTDFPADPRPDYPIEETPGEPEVLISVHRDGSEQRRYKGAGQGREFRLSFGSSAPITAAQYAAVLAHYAARSGALSAFAWTHPERAAEHYTVRYAEPPAFRLVGYDAYEGEVRFRVVPA